MKKQTIMLILLILLPVAAVAYGLTGNSVMVFDAATKVTSYYSYFTLVPEVETQAAAPLAGVIAVAAALLAAGFLVRRSPKWLKAVMLTSFASAMLALIPVYVQAKVNAVPGVLFPILMLGQCFVAWRMSKVGIPQRDYSAEAPRLKTPR